MDGLGLTAVTAAFWLGGLVSIDLIEVPSKFRAPGVDRSAAVKIGRVVFRNFGYFELAVGAALAFAAGRSGLSGVPRILPLVLLGLAFVVAVPLRLRLSRLSERSESARQDRDHSPTLKLHRLYVAADGVKMALLLAVIACSLGGK
jgi:hypothetical protein